VDLETEVVLAASIRPANEADVDTMVDSVMEAQTNLSEAGIEVQIEEAVADKGYHATDTLELADSLGIRTYIPEPKRKGSETRNWQTCRKRNAGQYSTIGVAPTRRGANDCNASGVNG